jgi:hypothetical protein
MMGHEIFVDSDKIDARCNEKTIIIYCIYVLIIDEGIVFNHIIMFVIQNKAKQLLF